jgi:superfamily II DNA/RNA helicase
LKRSSSFVDLTGSDDDEPAAKRLHYSIDLTSFPASNVRRRTGTIEIKGDHFEDNGDPIKVELEDELEVQERIQLTPAQLAVVKLAMDGHNIFLTGAAGSGKTATLKEILRRLKARFRDSLGSVNNESKFDRVIVVTSTSIAAFPLNVKTTYSFAGW